MIDEILKLASKYLKYASKPPDFPLYDMDTYDHDNDINIKFESWLEKYLSKYGIQLLHGNNGQSFLGRGEFNLVFEIIYDGKPAVLKISNDGTDYKIAKYISDLGEKLDDKYSRHIMKIYKTFKDNVNLTNVEGDIKNINLYFSICEKLKPINPHVKAKFNNLKAIENDKINIKPERLALIIKNYINSYKIDKDKLEYLTQNITKSIEEYIYDDNKAFNKLGIKSIINEAFESLSKIIDDNDPFYAIMLQIKSGLERVLSNKLFNKQQFPSHQEDDDEGIALSYAGAFYEFESLVDTINVLKEMGINFADLHFNNIMERPNTKELVMSDVGQFKIVKNAVYIPYDIDHEMPGLHEVVDEFTNSIQDVLTENKIEFLAGNNGSPFLGQGSYSTVFEVLYEGKQAVLKITESAEDYNNTIQISEIGKSAPKEYAKHFLKIFAHFSEEFDNTGEDANIHDKIRLYFIVCEKLNPANPHIIKKFYSMKQNREDIDPEVIRKAIDIGFKISDHANADNARDIISKHKNEIVNNILETFMKMVNSVKDITEMSLQRMINNILKNYFYDMYAQYFTLRISENLLKFVDTKGIEFPRANYRIPGDSTIDFVEQFPEFRSLIGALKYLEGHGIYFEDLAPFNIMERQDQSRTLVLSDVGLFKRTIR